VKGERYTLFVRSFGYSNGSVRRFFHCAWSLDLKMACQSDRLLVDTDALDFMTNYNLVLAGDVNRELADGIKRVVMGGIATGKGVEDIVRDLGRVVKDPESFRYAGSKMFTKAQYRMEVIARTEVLRAHN